MGYAVAGVGCIDGPVVRCQPAHHDAGAALRLVPVGVDALGHTDGHHGGDGDQAEDQSLHDMPPPESPEGGFWFLVILRPELAGLARIRSHNASIYLQSDKGTDN